MEDCNYPRVLFFDIETTPIRAYIWKTGKQYVDQSHIVAGDVTKIICIAYRWEHEKQTKCLVWDGECKSCEEIIEEFTKIIESADVVIGHNCDSFDIRHINTQRLLHGQKPIAWPTSEDSMKQIKKIFNLPSYRLNYIATTLTGAGKDRMELQDWIDIVAGGQGVSKRATEKMVRYCKKDVTLLYEVYQRVKPYLVPRFNRSLKKHTREVHGCPSCGSSHTISAGIRTLTAGRYRRYVCQDCGHTHRDTKRVD